MSLDRGTATAGEEPEAIVESGGDLRRAHGHDPRRGELDRERNTVEPSTDLVHRLGVRGRDRERRPHRSGPIGEQRGGLGEALWSEAGRVRYRERTKWPHLFSGNAEALSARGKDPELWARQQQRFRELPGGVEQVLAVVEEDEQSRVPDVVDDRSLGREVRSDAGADRRGHDIREVVNGCCGRELAEPGAVGRVAQHVAGDTDRQPRLPDAADAGHRDQSSVVQRSGDAGELCVAADERRELDGEVAGERAGRSPSRVLHARHCTCGRVGLRQRGQAETTEELGPDRQVSGADRAFERDELRAGRQAQLTE